MYSLLVTVMRHIEGEFPNIKPADKVRLTEERLNKILNEEWAIGYSDRGMGHGDYGIISKEDQLLLIGPILEDFAKHIVEVHNAKYKEKLDKIERRLMTLIQYSGEEKSMVAQMLFDEFFMEKK